MGTPVCYYARMQTLTVRVDKVHSFAQLPRYSHGFLEDAGADLFSVEDTIIHPGEIKAVKTGIRIELPPGFEGQIRPRSGLAKLGITVANAPGTIDPSYRGEVQVLLINHGKEPYHVQFSERIAQLVVAAYAMCEFEEANELKGSTRGSGGFGSTGK